VKIKIESKRDQGESSKVNAPRAPLRELTREELELLGVRGGVTPVGARPGEDPG
jgi:hypothetical protein